MKDIKKRHAGIVASEAYKKYFLKILADYKGEMSKEVPPSDTRKVGLFGSQEPQLDSTQNTALLGFSKIPPSSKSPSLGVPRRDHVSKRQYRVIYEEVCTKLADLEYAKKYSRGDAEDEASIDRRIVCFQSVINVSLPLIVHF